MIFSRNSLPVGSDWTSPPISFPSPAIHLNVFTIDTDVLVQVLGNDPGGFQELESEQILLRQGFNARDLPPFSQMRFKVWPGTILAGTGTIDVTAHD